MNKKYIFTACLLLALNVSAQKKADTTEPAQATTDPVHREVTVEKEFTPIVRDADRIQYTPTAIPFQPIKSEIAYSDLSVPTIITPTIVQMSPMAYGNVYDYAKQRGYFNAAMGNYWNMAASAGYRVLDTTDTKLGVWFQYNGTHGNIKDATFTNDMWQKFYNGRVGVNFSHNFKYSHLDVNAGYRYNRFNYLKAETSAPLTSSSTVFFNPEIPDQSINEFGIDARLSSVYKPKSIQYEVAAKYNFLGYGEGMLRGIGGAKENNITVKAKGAYSPKEGNEFGLAASLDMLFYNSLYDINETQKKNSSFGVVTLTPFADFEAGKFNAHIGANVNVSFDDGTVFRIAPDVRLDWEAVDGLHIFADATGGKQLNSLSYASNKYLYANPSDRLASTFVQLDSKFGVKLYSFKDFKFQAYVGYDVYKSMLLDAAYSKVRTSVFCPYVSYVGYDTKGVKFGASASYSYRTFATLGVSFDWRNLQWNGEAISQGLPKYTIGVNLKVTPIRNLAVYADYQLMADRAFFASTAQGYEKVCDKNVNMLNLGASYQFCKLVGVFAKFNNVMNQKYRMTYDIPYQRFNFMAGVNLTF